MKVHYNLYELTVKVINIILVERLLFDNEVKESLNKTFKSSGIKVSYYDCYIIKKLTTGVRIFSNGGAEGIRTPVRKYSYLIFYKIIRLLVSLSE